jgi:putative pyruvate formate lyase activating enzyme
LKFDLFSTYKECRLCPRRCGVDRTKREKIGFCGETDRLRLAYVGPHFGEEPPLTGTRGSGTVFFTGCSLRCSYCQNHQISHDGFGRESEADELARLLKATIKKDGVHNINFVTPDHFFPHVVSTLEILKKEVTGLPVIFNVSGYQSLDLLKDTNEYADIYLPDYKYSDPSLAARLSGCPDYPGLALDAIAEMVKQKGFLDRTEKGETALKGVLVRHLIIPGYPGNSINALTTLFLEFGSKLPLSLMSQYHAVKPQKDPLLNRRIRTDEFEKVYGHCLDLGFEEIFVQFPGQQGRALFPSESIPFVPDFRKSRPFGRPSHSSVDNDRGLC